MKTSRIVASSLFAGTLALAAPLAAVAAETPEIDDVAPLLEAPTAEAVDGPATEAEATDVTDDVDEQAAPGAVGDPEGEGEGDGDGESAAPEDATSEEPATESTDDPSVEATDDLPAVEDDVVYAPVPIVTVDDQCGLEADAWYLDVIDGDLDGFDVWVYSDDTAYSELAVFAPAGTVNDGEGLEFVYDGDDLLVGYDDEVALFAYQFTDEACDDELPVAGDGAILMVDGLEAEVPEEVADVVTKPVAMPVALEAAVPVTAPAPAAAPTKVLANTGADAGLMAAIAGGLVAVGAVLVLMRRRVSRAQV